MSYLTQNNIAESAPMHNRVAQCAAAEGVTDPDGWTNVNKRRWAAAPGWDDAWESYRVDNPTDDPGANETVVTDGMILSQVQALLTSS